MRRIQRPGTSPTPQNPGTDIESLAELGLSNPHLTKYYNVEVRGFVIIACIYERGSMNASQISEMLRLSPTTTAACLDALISNGLLRKSGGRMPFYSPTWDGRALLRKSGHPSMAD